MTNVLKTVFLDGDLTLYHNPTLTSTIGELMSILKFDDAEKSKIINQLLIKHYDGSFKKMVEDIGHMGGINIHDHITDDTVHTLEKAHNQEVKGFRLYPDSLDFLKELQGMNIRTALASNATDFYRKISREMFKLDKVLDNIYLSCEMGLAKTSSNFYKKILEDSSTLAENAIMIGDNLKADVLAAKDAGLDALHIVRNDDSHKRDTFSQHLETKTHDISSNHRVIYNLEGALDYIKTKK